MIVVVYVAAAVLVGSLIVVSVIRERRRKLTQAEAAEDPRDTLRILLKNSQFVLKAIAAFIPCIVALVVLWLIGLFGAIPLMIPILLFGAAIVFIKQLVEERRSQLELEEEMKTWEKDSHK